MANVLQWNQSTNSFSVSGSAGVTPVVGEGIDNNFSVAQTFGAGILQTGAAGTGNQSPLLNVGDVFSDFIADGVQWAIPSSASLTTTMTSGSAYLNSVRTLVPAVSGNAFPASSDTYVSFNNSGVPAYQSVANGATAPTPTSGYVQTAKVVTSPIQSPAATLSTSTSGSLASGTYGIALVAFDATGYGAVGASGTVAVTSAQSGSGSIEISWVNPLNETSMDIYATTAGSTTLGLVASGVTGTTYTYTGSVAPGAAAPAVATSNAIQSASRILGLFPYKEGQGFVTPEMFGATGLGFPYDDSEAIQNALNYVSSVGGGIVYCTKTYYCNNGLSIPGSCSLRGIYGPRPMPGSSNSANYPSQIIFNNNFGINQGVSSHVGGLLIMNYLSMQASANNSLLFSDGNAVFGYAAICASCTDCGIFGFNYAILYTNDCYRSTVDGIYFDCQSGIEINGATDIVEVRNCHGFPQLGYANIQRTGVAYAIIGGGSSWHKVIDCFALGFNVGYLNNDSGNNSFINCGIDGNYVGASGPGTGMILSGDYQGTIVVKNFQSTSNVVLDINVTGSSYSHPAATIDGMQVWGPNGGGIFQIAAGYVFARGFTLPTGRSDFGSVTNPSGNLVLTGPSASIVGASANNAPNINIYSDQDIDYIIYTGDISVSPVAKHTILYGVVVSSSASITLGAGAFRGQKITIHGWDSSNQLSVTTGVTSGTPQLKFSNLNSYYNYNFPTIGNGTQCYVSFMWDQQNWLGVENLSHVSTQYINSLNATTTSAPTSGTVTLAMPLQGTGGKQVILTFDAYENDTSTSQTIDFPTAFSVTPLVLGNNTGLTLTPSTTGVTITAPDNTTTYSGTAVIMGN